MFIHHQSSQAVTCRRHAMMRAFIPTSILTWMWTWLTRNQNTSQTPYVETQTNRCLHTYPQARVQVARRRCPSHRRVSTWTTLCWRFHFLMRWSRTLRRHRYALMMDMIYPRLVCTKESVSPPLHLRTRAHQPGYPAGRPKVERRKTG